MVVTTEIHDILAISRSQKPCLPVVDEAPPLSETSFEPLGSSTAGYAQEQVAANRDKGILNAQL